MKAFIGTHNNTLFTHFAHLITVLTFIKTYLLLSSQCAHSLTLTLFVHYFYSFSLSTYSSAYFALLFACHLHTCFSLSLPLLFVLSFQLCIFSTRLYLTGLMSLLFCKVMPLLQDLPRILFPLRCFPCYLMFRFDPLQLPGSKKQTGWVSGAVVCT